MNEELDVEHLIRSTLNERTETRSKRSDFALGLSASFTLVWAIYVTASGQWGRVGDQWASAVTMIQPFSGVQWTSGASRRTTEHTSRTFSSTSRR